MVYMTIRGAYQAQSKMGAAGRRWAVEHWQWRRQADRLARLL